MKLLSFILNLIFKKAKAEVEYITLEDLITASGKYPERSKQMTDDLKNNAQKFLKKVNALLLDLNIEKVQVTSGFRPPEVNKNVAGAAKKSLHQLCRAVDILDDKKQSLAYKIMSRPDLLKKHGLWLEHPEATIGKNTNWAHLDDSDTRKDRDLRVFKP